MNITFTGCNISKSGKESLINTILDGELVTHNDKGEYKQFMNGEKDLGILKLVQEFNQFDLYSKEDIDLEITDEIKKYYENLLNEYFFKELQW